MSQTVLDSIALGYQPIWGRQRQLAAVRLCVKTLSADTFDAQHLMEILDDDWPASAPVLVLRLDAHLLLSQALDGEPVPNIWLEVPVSHFQDADSLARLESAVGRGHVLVRRAALADLGAETEAPLGVRSLLRLTPAEAFQALQSQASSTAGDALAPFLPGQIYEGMGSHALAQLCLDSGKAWGVLDWPDDDVLHAYRQQTLACEDAVIQQVQTAIDRDSAVDRIERVLRQDPVLVYRLLVMVSASPAAQRAPIESLRHAILMLGFSALQRWLTEQLVDSDHDTALHPVRYRMSMRARLAQHLLEPGSDAYLRAEVYLTALLAQIDLLEHQPLADLLERLSLPNRVPDALLRRSGPYHHYLQVSAAQGDAANLHRLPDLCHHHGISMEHANRALLRMLSTSRDFSPGR
ncbi:HDOD domain-containing protein [Hydrogenophaga sp.]|uniref:HDOD domain-containing protein n=1 Tax=Hydrogenophaga sp. TaxID=1904254 RepID=UPI0035663EB2